MVVALGPGKFYGGGLPRPRYYTDVKFSSGRVDPPVPVMDPFLSWAHEAHWSMGGLSFRRLRLQGRIEGSVSKLRAHHRQQDKIKKKAATLSSPSPSLKKEKIDDEAEIGSDSESEPEDEAPAKVSGRVSTRSQNKQAMMSPSPMGYADSEPEAAAAVAAVRVSSSRTRSQKKVVGSGSGSGSEEEAVAATLSTSRRKRKLMDEFEKVAAEKGKKIQISDRIRRSQVAVRRTSPRKKCPPV